MRLSHRKTEHSFLSTPRMGSIASLVNSFLPSVYVAAAPSREGHRESAPPCPLTRAEQVDDHRRATRKRKLPATGPVIGVGSPAKKKKTTSSKKTKSAI